MEDNYKHNFTPVFSDFVLNMFNNIKHRDIEYIYRGHVTPEIVASTLEIARFNLEHTVDQVPLRHRIYFIIGEGLQNITKHQDRPQGNDKLTENNLIVISKKAQKYNIITANIIKNQNIPQLKEKLDRINELSINELRELARYVRRTTLLDDQSNANIGLFEIAKRSGSELLYKFRKIDDLYSFFYLSIEIPLSPIKKDKLIKQNQESIDYIIHFHDFLNDINAKLIFKGDFSQENIIALLEMLKYQIPATSTTIKIHNIMIEMLQNIEKHGDNIHNIKNWKPGFFMINLLGDKFYLTSANYLKNDKIDFLKNKLHELNLMNKDQLSKLYKQTLLEIDSITSKKTGLGFIDMRRRSGNPFNYTFLQVDSSTSLFIFQVTINNQS